MDQDTRALGPQPDQPGVPPAGGTPYSPPAGQGDYAPPTQAGGAPAAPPGYTLPSRSSGYAPPVPPGYTPPAPGQPSYAPPTGGPGYTPPAGPTSYAPPAGPSAPPANGDWRRRRAAWRAERHAQRAAWRAERRAAWGGGSGWISGAILIVLGVAFLLQNSGLPFLRNWWALFILIPAFGSLEGAWVQYHRAGGQLTPAATGPLIAGLVLTLVALAFLFGWEIGLLFPAFLILGGLALLFNAYRSA